MDFDNPKVYGDTSITDGLVSIIILLLIIMIIKTYNIISNLDISNYDCISNHSDCQVIQHYFKSGH